MSNHISDIEPSIPPATTLATSDGKTAQTAKPTAAHADAINQLFIELELAYHNQFHKAFPDARALQMAKQLWLTVLADLDPSLITAAGRRSVCDSTYLPTLHTVREHCETLMFDGLPDVKTAFNEACKAPEPKSAYPWSHPIVYRAGQASDWFFLKTQPEKKAFPVFERNYQLLRERLRQGETLESPVPAALEKLSGKVLSSAEQKEQIANLRRSLDL